MKVEYPPGLRVSVIVMTYNRARILHRCLESLVAQSLDRNHFELVLVDVSTVPVTSVVKTFKDRLDISHFHTDNRGVAANRNFGASKASADLLAFIDDDCVAEPSWLEELLISAEANPGFLVGGVIRNLYPDNVVACTGQVITEAVDACFNATSDTPGFFPGLNFAVPRDLYLSIGGCDEAFGRLAAEDRDFADRWLHSGHQQVRAAGAVVIHEHRTDLTGFVKQFFNYGRGAWRYHSLRRSRHSGAMSESLKLHRGLRAYVSQPLRDVPAKLRPRVWLLLLIWELANLAGFTWQAGVESIGSLVGGTKQ